MQLQSIGIKIEDAISFVATVRYQSISKAADALGIAQPSVTRRIQALEEELGVELLDRNTRPPKPTDIGLRVFEKCQDLVKSAQEVKSLVDVDSHPQGLLRIGMTQRVAELLLGELLQSCSNRYPELEMQATTCWSADLKEKVFYNELDAAIVQGPGNPMFKEGIDAERLLSLHIHVVAPKGRMPSLTPTLAECAPGPWILNPDGCSFRRYLISAFQQRGLPYRIKMDGFGTELQMQMVSRGLGLSLLPTSCIRTSIYRDLVDELDISDFQMESTSWLISHRNLGNLKQAVAFCGDFIRTSIEKAGHNSRFP